MKLFFTQMISMELKYPEERLGGSEYMDSFQHEERRILTECDQ
jgi:hypothetical protein